MMIAQSNVTRKGDTSGQYTCLSAIARSVSRGWFKIGGVREYTGFISVGEVNTGASVRGVDGLDECDDKYASDE